MLHKSPKKHSLDQAGCRFLHSRQTLIVTSQPLYTKTNKRVTTSNTSSKLGV